MTNREPIIYHCLISRANKEFLLLPNSENRWGLPTITQTTIKEDFWIPYEVETLRHILKEQLGLDAIVIRHLHESESQHVCELEAQIENWTPPEGSQWVDKQTFANLKLTMEDHSELLNTWLIEKEHGSVPELRAPWERPGWLAQATDWIHGQLTQLNYSATSPIELVKMIWSSSAILRIPTHAGNLYFKAVYNKPPNEVAMIHALAERYPNNIPQVIASDVDRGWMLMTEFDGDSLKGKHQDQWPDAARRFAEIQIGCTTDIIRWYNLHCPDRTNATMAELWSKILADTNALTLSDNGLEQVEIDKLLAMTPHVQKMWAELDELGIPPTIHLEDFRAGNIFFSGDNYTYYDWGDCVIAHPFFSAQRMLDYIKLPEGVSRWDEKLSHPDDAFRRSIRDAYLEPWTRYGSLPQLRKTFALSRYLNPVYQSARWYFEVKYLEPGCPWHKLLSTILAQILRRILEREGSSLE